VLPEKCLSGCIIQAVFLLSVIEMNDFFTWASGNTWQCIPLAEDKEGGMILAPEL